ncbi:undecaprenyl-diphosphate phosphatase [Vermiphilus pyriformis]|uniref:Undecaprenyl-diphosphatase n=1 Tax=candidate division TM6 bacterium JCVI TM6SC1 TaxID=1306947 RepID=A0A0D2K5Y9_9BACT|nr:hypothetical protein J120_01785 [candidate division TM6 bacterium JCVI TM6SC1]UNE35654.1 MAG: undecaprenyl-diphosphate phosphatase [Vermiphilus pyriformis]
MILIFLWIALQLIGESWPISSSGHLLLFEDLGLLYNSKDPVWIFNGQTYIEWTLSGVHAIIVLIWYYIQSRGYLKNFNYNSIPSITLSLLLRIAWADIITATAYLITYVAPIHSFFPLCLGFMITFFSLISTCIISRGSKTTFTFADATVLGLVQSCALIPGISRLATTYTAARVRGYNHYYAFALSWALQIPLALAAGTLSIIKGTTNQTWLNFFSSPVIVTWCLIAAVFAYLSLSLVEYLGTKNAWYIVAIYLLVPISICLRYGV